MITKHDLKQIKKIKKLGVFSISSEVDEEQPVMTKLNFGLKGDEEKITMVSFDDDFPENVLETLELVSYLFIEKGK
jgi:hypothetical protein